MTDRAARSEPGTAPRSGHVARNVEIKARIESVDALAPRVAALADQGPVELTQDDTFFTCDRGRLKLRAFSADQGQLIFYQRPDQAGPKTSSFVISPAPAPDSLREALSLAYGRAGRVRKQRTLYLIGRTRVHLDRVEGLGHFLELEVVLADGEPVERGVGEARDLMAALGIAPGQLVEGAYVDLLGSGVSVRRLDSRESTLHRDLRLRALRDSPDAFGETFADVAARPPAYWDDLTRSVTPPGRQVMLIACEGGEAVGSAYGLLDPERPTVGHVGGMWVDPAWRRRGVGRALLQEIVSWARARGLSHLRLWAPAHSPAAGALYRRAGFRETGARRPLPTDPALEIVEMQSAL